MSPTREHQGKKPTAKEKILGSALSVIRQRGYAATTVDDLCAEAGVTKGAFFHHFKSKEDLAIQAARFWSEMTEGLFASAPYQKLSDPLDRLLGYVRFRRELLQGAVSEFTCLVGTMVQEAYASSPAIREACGDSIFGHAKTLITFIDEAKKKYAPNADWSSESLARYTQAAIQGGFILTKAKNDLSLAAESIDHLYRYIELLFGRTPRTQATAE